MHLNFVVSQPRVLAGESLNAKILLDSADPDTIIESLTAELKGVGRTGWVNIHTDKIFETEKLYIHTQVPLCAPGMSISVGKHQFPFQMTIPESAPSSFESQFGSIRYYVKVVLTANNDQASCSGVFPITVVARSFFDDVPMNVLSPIDFRDEIDFTCCSLPLGCVSLMISLPRTAFRVGETVEAQVTINNRTRKGLKDCALQLSMKTQFEAMSRYEHVNEKKLIEQSIELIPLGNVRSRHKQVFSKCHIRIPEGAPPTQNYNRETGDTSIITIHYVLKLVALPGIEYEIPLVITSMGYADSAKDAAFILHNQRKSPNQQRTTRNIVE
ncbi:Arrestin domain-containing protein 15 [Parelaphostrongylus tenuis]|uniref:Arrestin domain-containing protein 15 n=1 Tax=Parelaphostrongylus tenuis TaxID=148309 RepID=A0AAD5QCL9_PARTN|nr:Arrestin domain-containing protein 15 [Parelaphostrongylus tenuis]